MFYPDPTVLERHLIPMLDVWSHLFVGCPCGAHYDPVQPGLVIHYAWDGRESYEQGRKLN